MKARFQAMMFATLFTVPFVFALAQQPVSKPFSDTLTKPAAAMPIEIPLQTREALATINQAIEVAQLRKQNYLLQLRLVLKVPNEYEWEEDAKAFKPPKAAEVKPPAKPEPAKP